MPPRSLLPVWLLVTVFLHFVAVSVADGNMSMPAPSPTLSGCQICASGDCSHAYLGGPGQFCESWLDQASQRQSCCCPLDARCNRGSSYEYRCSAASSPQVGTYGWVGIAVGTFAFLSCCSSVCWCRWHMAKKATRPPPPAAMPAVAIAMAVPGGAAAVPNYNVAPVYAPPTYNYGYGGGRYPSGGGGFSTGLSTAIGFGAGMMIADAVLDHGHHHFGGAGFDGGGGGFDGSGDFGGGGDFAGDF